MRRRVRFAPSPTGNLHIGSVRTALFNWIFAKRYGAELILRIEDTDLKRSDAQYEQSIFSGLKWLGIGFDEGPEEGGAFGPYRQSERIQKGIYQKVAEELVQKGQAYYCFDSEEELEQEREAARLAGKPYKYAGERLMGAELAQKLAAVDSYTIRFMIPENQTVRFKDLVRGDMAFDSNLLSDFVILKSDGSPSYNFAVVVDDQQMQITDVIRGEDHLSNTARHVLLYEALGYAIPNYAHLPIILGTDKSKLSKRHGAQSVTDYQQAGYLPHALINYLSLLGWSPASGKEKMTRDELIRDFDVLRISKSGAVFDLQKLNWLNGQYLRLLNEAELYDAALPYLSQDIRLKIGSPDQVVLSKMMGSVQDNLTVLSDINHYLSVYSPDFQSYQERMTQITFDQEQRDVLTQFAKQLNQGPLSAQSVDAAIQAVLDATGTGKGKVMKPIRLALTGFQSGPNLGELLALLGLDMIQERFSYLGIH